MGNSMGKKNKDGSIGKKKKSSRRKSTDLAALYTKKEHVVALSSTSFGQFVVELPKEIMDLDKDPGEGAVRLAEAKNRAASKSDPAHEMYERLKNLDVPAIMVPKPWSEVDQILSKMKPTTDHASSKPKPLASPYPKPEVVREPETIDMSDLMDGVDEEPEVRARSTRPPVEELAVDPLELIKSKPFSKEVRTLETSLSFSTIHTVRELDGGSSKAAVHPETVQSVLRSRPSPSPSRFSGSSEITAVAHGKSNHAINRSPSGEMVSS